MQKSPDTVPDRATVCVGVAALSVMVSEAERAVPALQTGVKVTEMLQLAPIVPEQVSVSAKSDALAPEIAMLVTWSGWVGTVLMSLIEEETLGVPGVWAANEMADEESDAPAGCVAVPEREIVCGLLGALSVKFKVAVRVPEASGENWTKTVQLAPGRIVEAQLFDSEKSAALVPARLIP